MDVGNETITLDNGDQVKQMSEKTSHLTKKWFLPPELQLPPMPSPVIDI